MRGISSRQVGRVVATLTDEVVSAGTVSKLTRDLDRAVKKFHRARLSDDWAYRGMHFTPDYPTYCGWPVRLPRRCWTISE